MSLIYKFISVFFTQRYFDKYHYNGFHQDRDSNSLLAKIRKEMYFNQTKFRLGIKYKSQQLSIFNKKDTSINYCISFGHGNSKTVFKQSALFSIIKEFTYPTGEVWFAEYIFDFGSNFNNFLNKKG